DFESFVCRDDEPAKPERKQPPKAKKPTDDAADDTADDSEPPTVEVKKSPRRKKDVDEPEDVATPVRPSEAEHELRALEKLFLEASGALDAPARLALWPRMARLNGVLGQADSAAICWSHALWERDAPPASWPQAWFGAERPDAGATPTARAVQQ